MRRRLVWWTVGLVLVLLSLLLVPPQLKDRGGRSGARPDRISDVDYVEVYRNADNFPNVARVCVRGLAFVTTSSSRPPDDSRDRKTEGTGGPALGRTPQWDADCALRRGAAR